jgi:leucine dehydrogenase
VRATKEATVAHYRTRTISDYEQVLSCDDPDSGLKAIIAVHDTTLGPALGGCRMWRYDSERAALTDALRLARSMTYKAAIAGLPLGGGKAVIMADPQRDKSEALFRAFGRMVDQLEGRYITGEDVGTSVKDIGIVARETRHVAGLAGGSGDPSPVTAAGVFHGIRAAVRHRTGSDDLKGARVAVQGLGHVGFHLCRLLHGAGAELVVSDVSAQAIEPVVVEFTATAVASDAIYDADADIFAPCALGGVINAGTVPRLKVGIVAGAANNQLAEADDGVALHQRDILYAPDYVINAGGLINVSWDVLHRGERYDRVATLVQVARIERTLTALFDRAAGEGRPTHEIADAIARDRLRVSEAA